MSFGKKYIDDIYTDKAYHWLMFIKHKKGGYLQKSALTNPVKEDNSENAFSCYCAINDQITKEFGFDESFKSYLDTEEKIALLKLDYIINGNAFSQTLYELEEVKKESNGEENLIDSSYDVNKEIGTLSQFLGGGIIDIKEYTIHQYLTAKQLLKNG